MKLMPPPIGKYRRSRAPHGARGLKLSRDVEKIPSRLSRPAWGAWIETSRAKSINAGCYVAPRMGRVD